MTKIKKMTIAFGAAISLTFFAAAAIMLSSSSAEATAIKGADDSGQRYIIIHNDLPFTIYPVVLVQEGTDPDCKNDLDMADLPPRPGKDSKYAKGSKKMFVNSGELGSGLKQNQTIRVDLPKCWYKAGRVYLFSTPIEKLEERLPEDMKIIKNTHPSLDDGVSDKICKVIDGSKSETSKCLLGQSYAAYPLDAPAQLVEFTFDDEIPENPITKKPIEGAAPIPMVDIDVSYVDQVYLPVALAVDDNGVSKFVGTNMKFGEFKTQLDKLVKDKNWSTFAAFTEQNWSKNIFKDLVDENHKSYHIPGGYNLIKTAYPAPDKSVGIITPPPVTPLLNTAENYMLGETTFDENKQIATNPTYDDIVYARWMKWINDPGKECSSKLFNKLDWPTHKDAVFEKKKFCNNFKTSVKFLWDEFSNKFVGCADKVCPGDLKECDDSIKVDATYCCPKPGTTIMSEDGKTTKITQKSTNTCVLMNIFGYEASIEEGKSEEQVEKLKESLQAVMRNVPYGPPPPIKCKEEWKKDKKEWSKDCTHPFPVNEASPRYNHNKWLLFWAPYNSMFNLNPYTRFVHNKDNGMDGYAAYSFSIDDKFGNYREEGKGFIINAGGDTKIENKEYYDTYHEYFVSLGAGWKSANVCGVDTDVDGIARPLKIAIGNKKNSKKNRDARICEITIYADNAKKYFIKLKIKEEEIKITDPQTGIVHTDVKSLNFVDPKYCEDESAPALKNVCQAIYFVPHMDEYGDRPYNNLPDNEKPMANLQVPTASQLPGSFSWNTEPKCDKEASGLIKCFWDPAKLEGPSLNPSQGMSYSVFFRKFDNGNWEPNWTYIGAPRNANLTYQFFTIEPRLPDTTDEKKKAEQYGPLLADTKYQIKIVAQGSYVDWAIVNEPTKITEKDRTKFAEFKTGDSVSDDPYIDWEFPNLSPKLGSTVKANTPIKITWSEAKVSNSKGDTSPAIEYKVKLNDQEMVSTTDLSFEIPESNFKAGLSYTVEVIATAASLKPVSAKTNFSIESGEPTKPHIRWDNPILQPKYGERFPLESTVELKWKKAEVLNAEGEVDDNASIIYEVLVSTPPSQTTTGTSYQIPPDYDFEVGSYTVKVIATSDNLEPIEAITQFSIYDPNDTSDLKVNWEGDLQLSPQPNSNNEITEGNPVDITWSPATVVNAAGEVDETKNISYTVKVNGDVVADTIKANKHTIPVDSLPIGNYIVEVTAMTDGINPMTKTSRFSIVEDSDGDDVPPLKAPEIKNRFNNCTIKPKQLVLKYQVTTPEEGGGVPPYTYKLHIKTMSEGASEQKLNISPGGNYEGEIISQASKKGYIEAYVVVTDSNPDTTKNTARSNTITCRK